MATSKLEFPPVTTSSPLNISDFDRTPSYCEENVYMLCKKLSKIGVSKNDGFDLFVAFISNDHKQIRLYLFQYQNPNISGHLRAMTPYFASEQSSRPYIRSPSYHQPTTYNYQQGFAYPQYGCPFCNSGISSGKRVKFLPRIKEKKRKDKLSCGDLSMYFSRGKGVQFPFVVTDNVVIKVACSVHFKYKSSCS
ncbi:hypothetical protein IFM89_039891, partial [Coptis chinensis]